MSDQSGAAACWPPEAEVAVDFGLILLDMYQGLEYLYFHETFSCDYYVE